MNKKPKLHSKPLPFPLSLIIHNNKDDSDLQKPHWDYEEIN